MAKCELIAVFLLAAVIIGGCSSGPSEKTGKDPVELIAMLNCEAVALRKARFELADRMRFIQDTLMLDSTTDSAKAILNSQLQDFEPYKDSIVNRSLELSKVIKFKLDSLITNELKELEQREAFDAKLTARLKELGCL